MLMFSNESDVDGDKRMDRADAQKEWQQKHRGFLD
jgi:hypothetical protein